MSDSEQMRFDGQVAVVTGGGGGIGGAHARLLASRGARVLVNDLEVAPDGSDASAGPSASWAPALAEGEEGAKVATVDAPPAPATSATAVVEEIEAAGGTALVDNHDTLTEAPEMIQAAVDAWGRVDIVIANAGIVRMGPFGELTMEDFDISADVSYKGSVRLADAAWPHLAKTQGRVLLTSSQASFGVRHLSAYVSSKAAIVGVARALAMDGEAHGIRVNAIMPFAASRFGLSVPGLSDFVAEHYQPEHVAKASLWLLHESTAATGMTFNVGGGFAARIAFGVGWGWADKHATPEDYQRNADRITSFDGGVMFPEDGGDALNFQSDRAIGWHLDGETLH
ncbi:MAG: SDR family oxidoreductase [Actinobacteria bacterium]|nr:SDR family oxidoreductase [Actinomycetota bacterium]